MQLLVEHVWLNVTVRTPSIAVLILDCHIQNAVVYLQLNVAYVINELISYIKLLVKVANNHTTVFLIFNLGGVDLVPKLPLSQRPLSPIGINRNAASPMHQLPIVIFAIKRIQSVFDNERCISLIAVDPNLHGSPNSADVHYIGTTT